MGRPRALEFTDIAEPDQIASDIANKWMEWNNYRSTWLELTKETRDYIFATDTRTTSSGNLGWKNSTHLPKLCQIRDNLQANYMAALFPNDKPIKWEGDDPSAETALARRKIEAYLQNKLELGNFRTELEKCVYDWIDYGNAFAMVEFANEGTVDPITGDLNQTFVGPRLVRISPLDIVFNPTASDFGKTPKILKRLTTLADLKKIINEEPENLVYQEVFNRMIELRSRFTGSVGKGSFEVKKNAAFLADGFSSFTNYFDSDFVEILEFYGDMYDRQTHQFLQNQHITVVDRAYVIRHETHPSWFGRPPIFHVGWRSRPDNLYSMGPLDNLVGLQYRLDHLENAKSDAIDMVLHPVMKIRGFVEDFDYGPNERIYVGDEGDVEFMSPDASFLQLDNQIAQIMQIMEEMAGAPRQAMGFRTPGEKTKFEVQVLENGANRVFVNKTAHFEVVFVEPILEAMLESARRNFDAAEAIRMKDMDFNFMDFITVTKEDITIKGKFRAIGARRFAKKANMLQDIAQISNTMIGQDPNIINHVSGYKIAELVFNDLLDLGEYELVEKNIRIAEQMEAQETISAGEQVLGEQALASQQAGPRGR